MINSKFSLRKQLHSFKYAFNGLKILISKEHNARIHLFFTIIVIMAGFYFNISKTEWLMIIFSIGLVFSLEIINSAIERLADYISKEKSYEIKIIKDLSAAGVLISALTSLTIGFIIFLPKILPCIFK